MTDLWAKPGLYRNRSLIWGYHKVDNNVYTDRPPSLFCLHVTLNLDVFIPRIYSVYSTTDARETGQLFGV